MLRLSHSRARMILECGRKYKLSYQDGIKTQTTPSYFPFGSAIDAALNKLLLTKDLEEAKKEFEYNFTHVQINGEIHLMKESNLVNYSNSDIDLELVQDEDFEYLNKTKEQCKEEVNKDDKNFSLLKNQLGYFSLFRKGPILLDSYYKNILPQIKEVVCVQKTINASNGEDEIIAILDFIAELHDGKRYLLDNKTSAIPYDRDAALRSQQLVMYYTLAKEEYKLDGVGFCVVSKKIQKDRVKICSVCGFDGSESRHKTCPNEIEGKRCNGEWKTNTTFFTDSTILLSEVKQTSIDMVTEVFQNVAFKIKNEMFEANLNSCYNSGRKCEYYDYCHHEKNDNLFFTK